MRDLAQQRELTHGRINDEVPKEKLLEFTVVNVSMLQDDEDAACRSQRQPPAQTRSSNSGQSQERAQAEIGRS